MAKGVEKSTLCEFLRIHDDQYFGKVLELRDAVVGWLTYTVHTFPHFTRHTVEHSEEIIFQLSKILFEDDDPRRPNLPSLSATEAYILVAAAYLHDAGMVVSDSEKTALLASSEWSAWLEGESVSKRYAELTKFRSENTPPDADLRNFLADVELRRFIAEFFRERHHTRAGEVVKQHQGMLGRFAFDDPMLQRTIGDVCVSHGLERRDLEDVVRFPSQRDIRRDKVNVRLMALLLRIGDLLDMSHDRACPLLLSAASPLPAESLPHWTQYSVIDHKSVTSKRIELRACCNTQEEHRTLYDWCKWIQEEVEFAGTIMSRSDRHGGWTPPFAKLGEGGSIEIGRSATAKYLFRSWHFHMDQAQIIKLLTNDLYSDPRSYVRELIQNAADATRCRLQTDLGALGDNSFRPEKCNEKILENFAIEITVRSIDVTTHTGVSRQQVFTINDLGVGMDQRIIESYFLQIGRSFYASPEFKRTYGFFPANGFGVGFLSVFAAANRVTVETKPVLNSATDSAIRFTMLGPKSYLITAEGDRRTPGTQIELILDREAEWQPGELTRRVQELCPRLEFPIKIDDFGLITMIQRESPDRFTSSTPVPGETSTLEIKAFDFEENGYAGEIYILSKDVDGSEDWNFGVELEKLANENPYLSIPKVPKPLLSNRGIATNSVRNRHSATQCVSMRMDYRGQERLVELSRANARFRKISDVEGAGVVGGAALRALLRAHTENKIFRNSEDRWKYIHRLSDNYEEQSLLNELHEVIPVFIDGIRVLTDWKEFVEQNEIDLIFRLGEQQIYSAEKGNRVVNMPENLVRKEVCAILSSDFVQFSKAAQAHILEECMAKEVLLCPDDLVRITFERGVDRNKLRGNITATIVPFRNLTGKVDAICALAMGMNMGFLGSDYPLLLNETNPLTCWLERIQLAVENRELAPEQRDRAFKIATTPLSHNGFDKQKLIDFFLSWNEPLMPIDDLFAPDIIDFVFL